MRESASSSAQIVFQPLTRDLIPSACRLSTQAGWNQTGEDWRRLTRLNPDGVRIWVNEGEVRASYSIVGYGSEAGWIGMILVDQAYRGGGLGKATFNASLEGARGLGLRVLGLDATDLGEPIYLKSGFKTICPIVRWNGVAPAGSGSKVPSAPEFKTRQGLHPGILALDARCSGVDRSALLSDMAASNGTMLSCEQDEETIAYAAIRPGRNAAQIGPVVALSAAGFGQIMSEATAILGGQPVICDVLHAEAGPILADLGLKPHRYLKRMTAPASPGCLCQDAIWCSAGFELG